MYEKELLSALDPFFSYNQLNITRNTVNHNIVARNPVTITWHKEYAINERSNENKLMVSFYKKNDVGVNTFRNSQCSFSYDYCIIGDYQSKDDILIAIGNINNVLNI